MGEVRRREWLDVTRLDFRHAYRSPLMEILIVLFLYIPSNAIYNWLQISPSFAVGGGQDSTEVIQSYINFITTFVASRALEQLWALIVFIVPPLVAFTTARAFEDGSFRTILSYPVKRWQVLLMRTMVPVVIIGTSVTLSILLAVFLMVPSTWNIGALILLLGVFWLALLLVVSSTVFLAVLTRRMAITALGGIAIWFSLMNASLMLYAPVILRWIGDPVEFITSYVYGGVANGLFPISPVDVPTTDSVLGLVGFLSFLVVLLLSVSAWLFNRTEA